MVIKYSSGFERDYNFYIKNINNFNFCGTLNPKFIAIPNGFISAKNCFYHIESQGKNFPCSEPELLNKILLTKAGINFHIKLWAEGRADGTLPLFELSQRVAKTKFKDIIDFETQFGLPEWVILAIEKQKIKLWK